MGYKEDLLWPCVTWKGYIKEQTLLDIKEFGQWNEELRMPRKRQDDSKHGEWKI